MNKIIEILRSIQNDCGDNMDRSGQYTSDRIGDVLRRLEEWNNTHEVVIQCAPKST